MPDWKRVKISFSTVKLRQFIEPVKRTVVETNGNDYRTVYGVTNTEGIVITGKKVSKDISNYITIDKDYFAYNPYRINVGSVGFNGKGIKGCVSPAYVVFKTRSGLSPEFLYLYLKSDFGNHLINWYGNRGGVRNALRYDDLCKIDVPKIDFNEQTRLLEKIKCITESVNDFDKQLSGELKMLKKLRQAVLQEAIDGKLTAEWRKQNPELISGDNHASKLLEKIKAKKERLIKEGKIKKEKPLSPIADEEKPFVLPEGWALCRWLDILSFEKYSMKRGPFGSTLRKNYFVKKGIRVFEQYNAINDDPHWARYYITEDKFKDLKSFSAGPGDLLISCSGVTLGRITELPSNTEVGIINQALLKLCLNNDLITNVYFKLLFRSRYMQKNIFGLAWGIAIPNMVGVSELKKIAIPLPPLAEQQAIVERVDKLMAMIDELEKQVTEHKNQSEMLMQAVLREAFEN